MGYALFTPPSGQSLPNILPNTDAVYGIPKFVAIQFKVTFSPPSGGVIKYTNGTNYEVNTNLNIPVSYELPEDRLMVSNLAYIPNLLAYRNSSSQLLNISEYTLTWVNSFETQLIVWGTTQSQFLYVPILVNVNNGILHLEPGTGGKFIHVHLSAGNEINVSLPNNYNPYSKLYPMIFM